MKEWKTDILPYSKNLWFSVGIVIYASNYATVYVSLCNWKRKKTDLIVNSFHDLVKTVREAKKLFVFNKKIKI